MRGRGHLPRILGGTGLLVLLALAEGCAIPQAKLLRPSCRRVQQGSVLKSLGFTVTAETQGLRGNQVIYEVSLYNVAGKPIKSRDAHYQNSAGTVAASKTLMVLESPSTFKDLELSIPVEELHIRKGDWPVSAKFRLYDVAGECLAQASCAVPPEPAKAVATVRPGQTPPTRAAATTQPTASTPRKDRPPTTQPTTQPTRPRPVPTEQKPAPRDRPTRSDERAHLSATTLPDVDVVAHMDALALAAGEWAKHLWFPFSSSDMLTWTRRRMDGATASQPTVMPSPAHVLPPTTRAVSTAPADTEQTPQRTRYVVQTGDSLARIAQRLLGDAARWPDIYALNLDQLASPDRLWVGMTLWIPAASPPEEEK